MKFVRIGDVCKLMTGGTPSRTRSEFFENGTIKWLVSGDINQVEIFDCDGRITVEAMKSSNTKVLPMNSVMIALNGQGKTRGTVALLRTEATCNQSLVSISPIDEQELLPDFLFHNLRMRYQELRRMTGDDGNDRRGLNMILIREIKIPLPSLEKQREIVKKLDSSFAEIDLIERNLELSYEKATQLLQSLLSESFGHSEIKSEPNDLSANQGLAMSKIYQLVRLGDLCNSISGLWTGKKPPYEKASVIRNTNFTKDCKLDLSNVAVLDVETKQLQTRKLIPGDLIVEKSGGGPKQAVGRVVYFNETTGTYSLSNFTSALRIKDFSTALPMYLQHFLYYLYVSGVTESMQSHSTGIRNLNIHQFLDIKVPVPSLEQQREIVEKLDIAFSEIEALREQINVKKDYTAALRQSLLSSAFTHEEGVA